MNLPHGRPKAGSALQAAALPEATPPRAVQSGAGRTGAAELGPRGGTGAQRRRGLT